MDVWAPLNYRIATLLNSIFTYNSHDNKNTKDEGCHENKNNIEPRRDWVRFCRPKKILVTSNKCIVKKP